MASVTNITSTFCLTMKFSPIECWFQKLLIMKATHCSIGSVWWYRPFYSFLIMVSHHRLSWLVVPLYRMLNLSGKGNNMAKSFYNATPLGAIIYCSLFSDFLFLLVPRICDNSRLLRKQFIEEHEQVFELERRRLSELHLVSKTLNHPYAIYPMEDLKVAEGIFSSVNY